MPVRTLPNDLEQLVLQIQLNLAALETIVATNTSSITSLETKVKALEKFKVEAKIVTVEYPGGSNSSNGAGVAFTKAKKNAFYGATPINAIGNARFATIVNPLLEGTSLFVTSTVGAPPLGTKEQVYVICIKEEF